MNGVLENLYNLLGDDARLLPVKIGTKRPEASGWQRTTIENTLQESYKANLESKVDAGGNIGVLCGNGLAAIDLDSDALAEEFLALNPKLENTLRSKGKRGCQFWVRIDGSYPKSGNFMKDGETRAEWRVDGRQSVIYGVHPDGMRYQILVATPATLVRYNEIVWPTGWRLAIEQQGATTERAHVEHIDELSERQTARIRAYVDAVPGAISGERGHDQTYKLACSLINGFALTIDQARLFLKEFNDKCDPRWSERELEHKLQDADRATHSKPRGHLWNDDREQSRGETQEKETWAMVEGVAAQELRALIGDVLCVGDEWFVVTDGVWTPTDRDTYRPLALAVLPERWRTQAHSVEVIKRLEGERQVTRDRFCGAAKFDTDGSVLLSVKNGVLRIGKNTIMHLPTNPAHGFTVALPVEYDAEARIPLFYSVLEQSLPDPSDRELLLDVLATALIPDARYEAALVMQGEAGTGKSTVIAPIAEIFGDAGASLSMSDICHHTGYKLAMLNNKLINLATELNALEMEDSGLFKQLVSGERFTARPIYGKPFEMRSYATLVFLANSLPRFKHGTDAEVRRLRFVRFNQKVANPDVTLKDRISLEAPGVFAELVRRASELLAGRKLSSGGEYGQEVLKRFAISNDPVGAFITQRCVLNTSERCEKEELQIAFESFRDEHAISDKLEARAFFKQLYERFDGVRPIRAKVHGERIQTVIGIALRDE